MKKLIILAIFMIFSPHVAYAESAWVLWNKTEVNQIKEKSEIESHYFWKILDAYPLYKDCQKYREKIWKTISDGANKEKDENPGRYTKITSIPFTVLKMYSSNMLWSEEVLCLPETVNPNLFERRKD